MSIDADAQIFSVIGGCKRSGRWLVPSKTTVLTLFGRAVIDLREAETSAESLSFKVTSAFASVTFIVPEGAEVRPSGMAVLASARSDVPVDPDGCHLPPIAIDAITAFGRFRVVTDAEFAAEEEAEQETVVEAPAPAPVPVPAADGPVDMVGSSIGATAAAAVPVGDDVSPIHDVEVPESLAGAGLDDHPAPFTPGVDEPEHAGAVVEAEDVEPVAVAPDLD